jgi:hypothetical protein
MKEGRVERITHLGLIAVDCGWQFLAVEEQKDRCLSIR